LEGIRQAEAALAAKVGTSAELDAQATESARKLEDFRDATGLKFDTQIDTLQAMADADTAPKVPETTIFAPGFGSVFAAAVLGKDELNRQTAMVESSINRLTQIRQANQKQEGFLRMRQVNMALQISNTALKRIEVERAIIQQEESIKLSAATAADEGARASAEMQVQLNTDRKSAIQSNLAALHMDTIEPYFNTINDSFSEVLASIKEFDDTEGIRRAQTQIDAYKSDINGKFAMWHGLYGPGDFEQLYLERDKQLSYSRLDDKLHARLTQLEAKQKSEDFAGGKDDKPNTLGAGINTAIDAVGTGLDKLFGVKPKAKDKELRQIDDTISSALDALSFDIAPIIDTAGGALPTNRHVSLGQPQIPDEILNDQRSFGNAGGFDISPKVAAAMNDSLSTSDKAFAPPRARLASLLRKMDSARTAQERKASPQNQAKLQKAYLALYDLLESTGQLDVFEKNHMDPFAIEALAGVSEQQDARRALARQGQ